MLYDHGCWVVYRGPTMAVSDETTNFLNLVGDVFRIPAQDEPLADQVKRSEVGLVPNLTSDVD